MPRSPQSVVVYNSRQRTRGNISKSPFSQNGISTTIPVLHGASFPDTPDRLQPKPRYSNWRSLWTAIFFGSPIARFNREFWVFSEFASRINSFSFVWASPDIEARGILWGQLSEYQNRLNRHATHAHAPCRCCILNPLGHVQPTHLSTVQSLWLICDRVCRKSRGI